MNGQRLYLDVQMVKAQIGALRHDYPELADDAQLLEDSLEGQTDFQEVIAQLVRFERDADTFQEAIRLQELRLRLRRERYEKQREAYRKMIHSLMDAAGQKKLVLPESTISVVLDRPGCIVTDEAALPDEFVKVERTPQKSLITAALVAGARVDGAELKNRGTHLTIRT